MATWRQIEAVGHRQQREAQKRQRELERLAKETVKRTAEEQARLEVETYENRLEVLSSVHKEQGAVWNWATIASSLPPPCPEKGLDCELRAKQRLLVSSPQQQFSAEQLIAQARSEDEQAFREAINDYAREQAHWEKMKGLACRVLAGEQKSYIEALEVCDPLAEISDLGSSIDFTVHSAKLIEATLKVKGSQAIPSEVKTLTPTGKLSVKPMATGHAREIYQGFVCGCLLRIAREVFALLPVEKLLVTAYADALDSHLGRNVKHPVFSVVMPRRAVKRLNFNGLNPFDSLQDFQHRGDFRTMRKTGAFLPIVPLTPADILRDSGQQENLDELLNRCRKLREELNARIAEIAPDSAAPASQNTPPL